MHQHTNQRKNAIGTIKLPIRGKWESKIQTGAKLPGQLVGVRKRSHLSGHSIPQRKRVVLDICPAWNGGGAWAASLGLCGQRGNTGSGG